tara:strand:- start:9416 stop:10423 length:1008 start_codon:yes stop_codon:yes gene_type:complete
MSTSAATQVSDLAAAIAKGKRAALAEALNLLDDRRPAARQQSAALLAHLQSEYSNTCSHLIGITGPPGVGKSSLSAALIAVWRQRGLRVGILAVDPSSPFSGGALLGDRVRMQTNSEDDGVFVRSLSSRGQFGGLSAEVWPMCIVMLAGFDIVLIETVGVGQREVDVSRLCDTTCYVAQPGSGDSVQFLKAGILEVPHILVVNKKDMGAVAQRTLSELGNALNAEHPDGQWQVPVLATSAMNGSGIEALADVMAHHHQSLQERKQLARRRRSYQAYWIHKRLEEEFGSFGIDKLGGEKALLEQLQSQDMDLFKQYDSLRQQCCNGEVDKHESDND